LAAPGCELPELELVLVLAELEETDGLGPLGCDTLLLEPELPCEPEL
jgi:hypothetical protein